MKTKEELNTLKDEVCALRDQLAALNDDELAEVVGGVGMIRMACGNFTMRPTLPVNSFLCAGGAYVADTVEGSIK